VESYESFCYLASIKARDIASSLLRWVPEEERERMQALLGQLSETPAAELRSRWIEKRHQEQAIQLNEASLSMRLPIQTYSPRLQRWLSRACRDITL